MLVLLQSLVHSASHFTHVIVSVNGLSDISPAQFAALYGGEIGAGATAGAVAGKLPKFQRSNLHPGGVSLGVIIGSIVGGVLGTAAVAGGIGGVVYYRKKRLSSPPTLESQPNPTYVSQTTAPANGIDIHNFHRGKRKRI